VKKNSDIIFAFYKNFSECYEGRSITSFFSRTSRPSQRNFKKGSGEGHPTLITLHSRGKGHPTLITLHSRGEGHPTLITLHSRGEGHPTLITLTKTIWDFFTHIYYTYVCSYLKSNKYEEK
jgi:hypothetical protein